MDPQVAVCKHWFNLSEAINMLLRDAATIAQTVFWNVFVTFNPPTPPTIRLVGASVIVGGAGSMADS